MLTRIRDPERRVLTTVEWDAMPDWASQVRPPAPTDRPDPLHAATIGGFDVHELDIDEIAPSQSSGAAFESDAVLWSAARRVARVQLLPASSAMLMPLRQRRSPRLAGALSERDLAPAESRQRQRRRSQAGAAQLVVGGRNDPAFPR